MSYSLSEAAKAVGRTKPAILSAIQKGRISAKKNDLGQWEIDPAELHRVYPPNKSDMVSLTDGLVLPNAEKETLIRELKVRLEVMEQLCRQLEGERDRERQNHDDTKRQLMALLPPKTAEHEPDAQKKGFFRRLWPF